MKDKENRKKSKKKKTKSYFPPLSNESNCIEVKFQYEKKNIIYLLFMKIIDFKIVFDFLLFNPRRL